MSVIMKGPIKPSGKSLYRGAFVPPSPVDPLWPETVALINGDSDPWYANRIEGGAQVINPNNLTTGKFGNGFDIGVSPISLTESISVPTATDFTMEMWVYYRGDAISGSYTCLSSSQLMLISNDRRLQVFTGGLVNSVPGVIKLNDWTHVACCISSTGVISGYADGVRVSNGNMAFSGYVPYTGLLIGAYDGSYRLNGKIDEFRITRGLRYTGDTYTVPTAPFPVG